MQNLFVKGGKDINIKGNNILVIQFGDIGDVVLTAPVIHTLNDSFPDNAIYLAVKQKAAGIGDCIDGVNSVIAVETGQHSINEAIRYNYQLFSKIRRTSFDLAIDLRSGTRGAIMAFLSAAKQRLSYYSGDGKLWRNRLFTHLSGIEIHPDDHVVDYYLALLKQYDLGVKRLSPQLNVSSKQSDGAQALLSKHGLNVEKPFIALQPFSLWAYKELSIDKYVHLIDWIGDRFGITTVITGGPDESIKAKAIAAACKGHVINLAGETPLHLLPAVYRRCCLFIGIDSVGLHIASAVGTPTVGIYGPSAFPHWAPRSPKHMTLTNNYPCIPCRQKGCQDSEQSRCLDTLTDRDIGDAVTEHMKKMALIPEHV